MGKVAFPLHNVRKDVLNNWHLEQISEEITVSESADQYGYYTASLVEVPASSAGSSVLIQGLSEYKDIPVDIKTGELILPTNSFYVNYNTGEVLFHSSKAGNTFTVQYYGKGSLVEAEDVNNVNDRTESVESAVSSIQPTLDEFRTELDSGMATVSTMAETVGLLESNVTTMSEEVVGVKTSLNDKADTSFVESQINETKDLIVSYVAEGGEVDRLIDSKLVGYVSESDYTADQANREAAYDAKYSQSSDVSALETAVSENTANIASNLEKITTNSENIQALQTSVSQLSESKAEKSVVDEHAVAISGLTDTVAQVESTAGTNSANISTLTSSLAATNENVSSVSSRVEAIETDYVKSAALEPLATKEELENYIPSGTLETLATKEDISDMATKTDLQDYVQTSTLDTLATKTDLEGYVQTEVLDTLATKSELEGYIPVSELQNLATTDAISDMATKTDLQDYVQTAELSNYATVDSISDMATKTELQGYVQTGDLDNYATVDSISDMATKTDLQDYVQTGDLDNYATVDSISDMATKTDLQDYVQTAELSNYATVDSISDMATKTELQDYVRTEALDNYATVDSISDMATKTELQGYVQSSELSNYVTSDAISDMATKTDLQDYVQSSVLDNYATTDAISDMATRSDLDNYATTDAISDMATRSDLDNYVQTETLGSYATLEELENNYVRTSVLENYPTLETLEQYATLDQLSNYATLESIDPLATREELVNGYVPNTMLDSLATKSELDSDMSQANSQIDSVSNNVDSNYYLFLEKIVDLEMKIEDLSRTNIDNVPSTAQITYSDPAADVVISSDATVTQPSTITAKSIEVSSLNVDSTRVSFTSGGKVKISEFESTGTYPKSQGNAQVIITTDDYVEIRNSTFGTNGYNAIEIGLNNAVPKSVIIDNCQFGGNLTNNAILVFGHQDDAIVKITNCTFASVSNALRISNRTNTKGTFIFENCAFNQWDSNLDYAGAVICEDYTSRSVEAETSNNLFAPEKIKIKFVNCTGPDGSVLSGDSSPSTYCGSRDENQIMYVYNDYGGSLPYSSARYPEVSFS